MIGPHQRDWIQEKNFLNAWILKKDDAIIQKYQWNHRFLWMLSKIFGFWTQTNPNDMIGERLSKNSCDWVASVCFYRKKIIHYKRRSKHRWEWGRGWRNKNLVSEEEDDWVLRSRSADIGGWWWCGRGPRRAPVVFY